MSILEQAQKLGEAILLTDEYKRFTEAEKAQSENEAAMKEVEAYNKLRNDFALEIQNTNPPKEKVDEIRKTLSEAFDNLGKNPVIGEYIEANKNYSQLIDNIQNIIEMYASGGDSQGCGGSCSSCSGGCGH
jgi:cell fate (sporulation/competence/biofilm development) regulator YlbF (YheA/YmcA/DUF963 family)